MSHNFIDITDAKFGRLKVLSRAPNDKSGRSRWLCQCDCGEIKEIDGYHLRKGLIKSCGCYAKEKSAESQSHRDYGDKKPRKDLTGLRFGRLLVKSLVPDKAGEKIPTRWSCVCDCGREVIVRGYNLSSGGTRSCGCLALEKQQQYYYTHGQTGTRLYRIWSNMRSRCLNPHAKAYNNYGGRGIKICHEWSRFENFYEWALTSGYNETLTIDRIDVNSDYTPENCRWATHREQQRNKRNSVKILFQNKIKTTGEWSELLGCRHQDVFKKILELEGRIS